MNKFTNTQLTSIFEECTRGSDENRLSFPEVVMKLIQANVERYDADLMRSEKIFYMPNGESQVVACAPISAKVATDFSAEKVKTAIRAIQSRTITYKEFCDQIAAAGCVNYSVYLNGRRAIYFGRNGDSHTELFPSTN